jgi:hypothetical protein
MLGVTAYTMRRIEAQVPPSDPGDPATNYASRLDVLYDAFDAVYSAASALRDVAPTRGVPSV